MKTLIILMTFLLVSCATQPDIVIPPGIVKPLTLDARVFELCDKLVKLPEKASFDDVLITVSTNAQIFGECSSRHKINVELLKQLSNRKDN
jgi:hypothetical protein